MKDLATRQTKRAIRAFAANGSLKLAPRAGFEPATYRLTVECSTAELPGIICAAEVRLLIQMLSRFAKRFFKKNHRTGCETVEKDPTLGDQS